MKKLLGGALLALSCISLLSCSSEQSIKFTNENGEVVEVTLENSKDPEVIQHALRYIETASYNDVKYIEAKGKHKSELRLNDKNNLNLSFDGLYQLDTKDNLFANFDFNFKSNYEEKDKKNSLSYKGSVEASYADLLKDPFLYLNYDINGKNNSNETKLKAKSKISGAVVAGLIKELFPNQDIGEIIYTSATEPTFSEGTVPSETTPVEPPKEQIDYIKIIDELKKLFPQSNLELDNVSRSSFELKASISVNDAIKIANENSTNTEKLPLLEHDSFLNASMKFDIKTARPTNMKLELDCGSLVNAILSANKELAENINKPVFKISLDIKVKFFNKGDIKRLTEDEKKEYELLTKM